MTGLRALIQKLIPLRKVQMCIRDRADKLRELADSEDCRALGAMLDAAAVAKLSVQTTICLLYTSRCV